jgi:hypothetical protein
VLIGKRRSTLRRIVTILLATLAITSGGILLVAGGAGVGLWAWPPQPSSAFGVGTGLIGGAIVLFEMALLPRKWLRHRWLGATKRWMQLHIWLGLVCVPVVLVHTGFGFGGPLTTVTLVLFLAVIASGLWGLILQQWLPQKMLADVPGEIVASQADVIGNYHAEEALHLIVEVLGMDSAEFSARSVSSVGTLTTPRTQAAVQGKPILVGQTAVDVRVFTAKFLLPYLRTGRRSRSPLASRAEAEQRFARLRELTSPEVRPVLDRLETLCDLRRQWDMLVRIQFWLDNWLWLHLPLSVAMTGLMVLHAFRALKYW